MSVPEHGTRARYVRRTDPCRCAECKRANALYVKEYREANREQYLKQRRRRRLMRKVIG